MSASKDSLTTFAGVDLSREPLIVAEIGNNHEGKFDVACEMVRKAVECGVGAVKFQTFRTEHYVSRADAARFERLKRFELTFDQFAKLAELTHSLGAKFVSTPFDLESAAFLTKHVDFFKVASADNDFYPLIRRVAESRKPMVISSGVSDLAQVKRSVSFIRDAWRAAKHDGELAVLHCVSCYPTPPEQASLGAIPELRELGVCVGYSDHTIGLDAALTSIALGATLIEKHFTLDKNYSDFRDHQLSSDPAEMTALVQRARQVRAMIGGRKVMQPCEEPNAALIRRSIVAGADLPKGHTLRMQDFTWIRPAGGLPPGEEGRLVGRRLKASRGFGEQIRPDDVE